MKKLLTITLLLCATLAMAQEPLTYSKVIQVDSVKKEVIYSTLMMWIGTNYHGINNNIQLSDKEAGYIIIPVSTPYIKTGYYQCYGGSVDYKMKFQIKDSRFKVELFGFTHEINRTDCAFNSRMGIVTSAEENPLGGGLYKSYNNKIWKEIQQLCKDESDKIFLQLGSLKYASSKAANDNW